MSFTRIYSKSEKEITIGHGSKLVSFHLIEGRAGLFGNGEKNKKVHFLPFSAQNLIPESTQRVSQEVGRRIVYWNK